MHKPILVLCFTLDRKEKSCGLINDCIIPSVWGDERPKILASDKDLTRNGSWRWIVMEPFSHLTKEDGHNNLLTVWTEAVKRNRSLFRNKVPLWWWKAQCWDISFLLVIFLFFKRMVWTLITLVSSVFFLFLCVSWCALWLGEWQRCACWI